LQQGGATPAARGNQPAAAPPFPFQRSAAGCSFATLLLACSPACFHHQRPPGPRWPLPFLPPGSSTAERRSREAQPPSLPLWPRPCTPTCPSIRRGRPPIAKAQPLRQTRLARPPSRLALLAAPPGLRSPPPAWARAWPGPAGSGLHGRGLPKPIRPPRAAPRPPAAATQATLVGVASHSP